MLVLRFMQSMAHCGVYKTEQGEKEDTVDIEHADNQRIPNAYTNCQTELYSTQKGQASYHQLRLHLLSVMTPDQ